MLVRDLFVKDINRDINGVIKVQDHESTILKQELEEYVVTKEMSKHFISFFSDYEKSLSGLTSINGVWITGFFGSGKSHFLKILSILLENKVIDHYRAIDIFEDKIKETLDYERMRTCCEANNETILFNIDSYSIVGSKHKEDAILRVFVSVFYNHLGFFGTDYKIARLEKHLDDNHKYNEFKKAILEVNGKTWEKVRKKADFYEDDIIEVLMDVLEWSEEQCRNVLSRDDESLGISVNSFAGEVKEYMNRKDNVRLLFMIDEVGQYIADNTSLMLQLQSIVEELNVVCNGKAWVVVTSQEEIDAFTKVKGQDFSKIKGRFSTAISITSSSVDEVIKKRLLEKTEAAKASLEIIYAGESSNLRQLISFQGTKENIIGFKSEKSFIETYPFVPYQLPLLQKVLEGIRNHGTSGKHIADGARSMLSSFQETAKMVQDYESHALVSFHLFYDATHAFFDGGVRRVIENATNQMEKNENILKFDVDVLKVLFLIRYTDLIPATIENIAILLISDLRQDKLALKKYISESLHRLIQENYVSKNGEKYYFLTNEEQEINRDIININWNNSNIKNIMNELIYKSIYDKNKFRYNDNDYSFTKNIDSTISSSSELEINILSELDENVKEENVINLALKSTNRNSLVVALSPMHHYIDEIVRYYQISTYVKTMNADGQNDVVRKIIVEKRDEQKDIRSRLVSSLSSAIADGMMFVNGRKLSSASKDAQVTLDSGMEALVKSVYTKNEYIDSKVKALSEVLQQCTQPQGSLQLLNKEAVSEVEERIKLSTLGYMSLKDVVDTFKRIPYGYRQDDISMLLAVLFSEKKIEFTYEGRIESEPKKVYEIITKTSNFEKTKVKKKEEINEIEISKLKRNFKDFFETSAMYSNNSDLVIATIQKFDVYTTEIKELAKHYDNLYPYPGKQVLEQYHNLLQSIMFEKGNEYQFVRLLNQKIDDLLEGKEDIEDIQTFFTTQKEIFNKAIDTKDLFEKEKFYFSDEIESTQLINQIRSIVYNNNPYRMIKDLTEPTMKLVERYNEKKEEIQKETKKVIEQYKKNVFLMIENNIKEVVKRDVVEGEYLHKFNELENGIINSSSLTNIDGMKQQAINLGNLCEKKIDQLLVSSNQPMERKNRISRNTVLRYANLHNEEEIHQYVERVKEELIQALKDYDSIEIN